MIISFQNINMNMRIKKLDNQFFIKFEQNYIQKYHLMNIMLNKNLKFNNL